MSDQLPQKQKGRKAAKFRGAHCLNCGTPLDLSDVYCSYCGQLNTTKNLSLKDFLGEFIGSVITYDSRFRYTLKDLLFRPGVITRNYVHGQRLKYANPFRFFLSVSIIFFLLQGLIETFTGTNLMLDNNQNTNQFELKQEGNNFVLVPKEDQLKAIDSMVGEGRTQLDSVLKEQDVSLDSILQQEGVPPALKLDSIITASTLQSLIKDTVPSYNHISEEALDTLGWLNRTGQRMKLYYDFYQTTEISNPAIALDSLDHRQTNFNRWAYQKNETVEQFIKNPRDFGNYLLEKIPFFVFFFTPFYALFFWLIYSKKKYTYMEHMIFIFHVFSFVFLAMLIALLPDILIGQQIFGSILFLLIGPFYFYKALRNFYKQNRIITIIKFIILNTVFFYSAIFAALIFILITAVLY